jgi:hypothetical protein
MSVNYYIAIPGQPEEDGLHVGLLAGGMFRFRAHPDRALVSFDAWLAHLQQHAAQLVDEYGDPILLEPFLNCVVRKRDEALANRRMGEYHNAPQLAEDQTHIPGKRYRDAKGFLFFDFNFS